MTLFVNGNYISLYYSPDDVQANDEQAYVIQLPDGYSYENIHILSAVNTSFHSTIYVSSNYHLSFPPINSKSPCYLAPIITNINKYAELKFLIEKFGQIPDTHYFDKAFDPILVTGDDSNEYNVIPSDQFK